jgi:hypothetical protein
MTFIMMTFKDLASIASGRRCASLVHGGINSSAEGSGVANRARLAAAAVSGGGADQT